MTETHIHAIINAVGFVFFWSHRYNIITGDDKTESISFEIPKDPEVCSEASPK